MNNMREYTLSKVSQINYKNSKLIDWEDIAMRRHICILLVMPKSIKICRVLQYIFCEILSNVIEEKFKAAIDYLCFKL